MDFFKKYPEFIYDLEFELFISDPEKESKKLMKFCELPWDKKCLQFYKRKDIISKTTSYLQIRKPIYKHPEEKYLPYKKFLNNCDFLIPELLFSFFEVSFCIYF